MHVRARIILNGIVQGVGFRPFVHRLAESFHLSGWVANTSQGVIIEVEGDRECVNGFYQQVLDSPPPMATIMQRTIEFFPAIGTPAFEIREGVICPNEFTPISPDMAMCSDCYQELIDPDNRRYGYPFINCTNCGPRFTIIQATPYDRNNTTMRDFEMCQECEAEYNDITNRRYHAEPNACPVCGPEVWLWEKDTEAQLNPHPSPLPSGEGERHKGTEAYLRKARGFLMNGCIVAVKGIGGFHLACNAMDNDAVKRLREKKRREKAKPFAVMLRDIEKVRQYCEVNEHERDLLLSTASPIVLLKKKMPCLIPDIVAPNNKYLGVMLPYTPLYYLLMNDEEMLALVMTSANLSDKPLIKDNDEAMDKLSGVADYILMHNRDICNRCDDSVVQVVGGKEMIIRRARGYAPYPITLDTEANHFFPVLAVGTELKSTFCLSHRNFAFLSQHLGDLKNLETMEFFKEGIKRYQRLFQIEPEFIAHDLHPDYLSTRFALEIATQNPNLKTHAIQHHHAHIASCMAENGVNERVLGIALDGIGYGIDGHIWGGEFLLADYSGFERIAQLKYIPMPGADMATKQPWRMAVSYLYAACGQNIPPKFIERWGSERVEIIIKMMEQGLNSPLTSSAGRLFDAVASIIGIKDEIDYEAQAAIELEMMAEEHCNGEYGFFVDQDTKPWVIDTIPIIRGILNDMGAGAISSPPFQGGVGVVSSIISARFHNTIINMIQQISRLVREKWMINKVALSGGVFQNRYLLERVKPLLEGDGFIVFSHSKVPANDGGISLGQAVIASRRIKNVSGYTCQNNEDFRLSGSR